MAEVEMMKCVACGQNHPVVGAMGEIPILHCPKITEAERVMLVSALSPKN